MSTSHARRGASAGRRLRTITVDQAISSASNVLVSILAARVLGVSDFGWFGLVLITYVATQGAARALVGEPLLVRPVEAESRPGEAGPARAREPVRGRNGGAMRDSKVRRLAAQEDGAATAEYAITIMAAVGFAGLLVVIMKSGEVQAILTDLVRSALSVGG